MRENPWPPKPFLKGKVEDASVHYGDNTQEDRDTQVGGEHLMMLGAAYLADVLLGVLRPQLLVLLAEAHEGEHKALDEVVNVGLEQLPGGVHAHSVRQILENQIDDPWRQILALHSQYY